MLTDEQLLRYNRQIMLPQLDAAGQQALLAARVLVVGAGGLGCPVVLYLAAAGVGQLQVADDDTIDLPNLQRQVAFRTADLGRPKALALCEAALAINPGIRADALAERLAGERLLQVVAAADAVVDASDNAATRFAVNAACVRLGKPLVSGAAIRFDGQLAVFDTRQSHSPCYRCLYAESAEESRACAENGVLSPLVGVIGAMQAVECIKLLAGVGESLAGRLALYDALHGQWREFRIPRDPGCPVCAQRPHEE